MSVIERLVGLIPDVKAPTQKHLSFKQKMTWTGIVLLVFFILSAVPIYGLGENALSQFEFLSVVLGASFGSIVSLGIGPIVTASIVLQLLVGSGILNLNLQGPEGRAKFQGLQRLLTVFFIIVQAIIYVVMGGLSPTAGIPASALILQLFIGGMLIVWLDGVINKWGFGSGVSLFIAAGVSQTIFIRIFSPLRQATAGVVDAGAYSVGAIPQFFQAIAAADSITAGIALGGIIATVVVFGIVVFAQAMKVEIPLSFGRVRGHGIRWPLNFVYTNVIPVILVSALVANLQLFGSFGNGTGVVNNIIPLLSNTLLLEPLITGYATGLLIAQSVTYVLFFVGASVLFSWFWMQTSGLDPKSQAKQMMASGLQIPGFRKDARVLERMLKRYIYPLTIMGGIFIGLLASLADMTGVFGGGTGVLLTVMIIYKLYEDIAKHHMEDMNPMLRKMMG